LFERICIRNGDIITQVNDISLRQPEQGFAFYEAFQNERNIRISILRDNQPMSIGVHQTR
jgi:type II secretory pathway component PulC